MPNQYFEGVLQLRNPNPELYAYVKKAIKDRKGIWVAKEIPQKDGTDLYLSSQRFLQVIGKRLNEDFIGQLKVSNRLFSKNHLTSRNVYRINVLFRLAAFKRGDEAEVLGRQVKILAVKRLVQVQDVKNGEKFAVPFDRVQAAVNKKK